MSLPTRWSSGDGACLVELSPEALEQMIALADAVHPLENGASLFGRYSSDQHSAFIEGIAPVPRDAERGRFHFRRGIAGLATFFRRLFRRTSGKSFYVGEFHSHPGGSPHPSGEDDAAHHAIAADPACQCRAPVLVIVGDVPGNRNIGVFVHTRGRKIALIASVDTSVPDAQSNHSRSAPR